MKCRIQRIWEINYRAYMWRLKCPNYQTLTFWTWKSAIEFFSANVERNG